MRKLTSLNHLINTFCEISMGASLSRCPSAFPQINRVYEFSRLESDKEEERRPCRPYHVTARDSWLIGTFVWKLCGAEENRVSVVTRWRPRDFRSHTRTCSTCVLNRSEYGYSLESFRANMAFVRNWRPDSDSGFLIKSISKFEDESPYNIWR